MGGGDEEIGRIKEKSIRVKESEKKKGEIRKKGK